MRKKFKAIRGNGYRFVPKGGAFPTETIMLVVRSFGLWEAYTQTCPQMGQNLYHGMLMPLHDSMPSFMNFRRVLDLVEFKTRHLNVLPGIHGALEFEIHSHFLPGNKECTQGHIFDFFNQFIRTGACACSSYLNYAHKCIENSLNG